MKIRNVISAALATIGAAWVARAAWGIPAAVGASVAAIAPTAVGTLNYRDRRFHNTEPSTLVDPVSVGSVALAMLTRARTGRPARAIPLATPLAPADAADLAVTWYGHATAIIEIDGYRVLTDPVWSERVSPSSSVGPARLHPVPVPLAALPAVDAVVISHDHYDHLDKATVQILLGTQDAPFVVPTGIGAHLRHWGVPASRIVELAWGESAEIGGLTLTCAEARHFSGRGLVRNTTLWASWVLAGRTKRVYFGGDTGYTRAFREIGIEHGPFDLTLLPVGAYGPQWPDIHMNPEEAVTAHADLCRGAGGHGVLMPIHWATYNLAFHGWAEPAERVVAAASVAGTQLTVPMPGQRVDLQRIGPVEPWWEKVSGS